MLEFLSLTSKNILRKRGLDQWNHLVKMNPCIKNTNKNPKSRKRKSKTVCSQNIGQDLLSPFTDLCTNPRKIKRVAPLDLLRQGSRLPSPGIASDRWGRARPGEEDLMALCCASAGPLCKMGSGTELGNLRRWCMIQRCKTTFSDFRICTFSPDTSPFGLYGHDAITILLVGP
jgi:hypothetical protein